MKTATFQAIEFPSAFAALQHTEAAGGTPHAGVVPLGGEIGPRSEMGAMSGNVTGGSPANP